MSYTKYGITFGEINTDKQTCYDACINRLNELKLQYQEYKDQCLVTIKEQFIYYPTTGKWSTISNRFRGHPFGKKMYNSKDLDDFLNKYVLKDFDFDNIIVAVVLNKEHKIPQKKVSELTGLSVKTISRWIKQYENGCSGYGKYRRKLDYENDKSKEKVKDKVAECLKRIENET